MRKALIAFFLSIFFLSGLMGFGIVRQARAIAEINPGPMTPANQINLILVRVNDLTLSHPSLTSIWGIFISRSDFPGLIMKRIYPEAGSPISVKLGQTFSLDEQKQLNLKFLNVMRDLDMPAVEIVIVDNIGMSKLVKSISTQSHVDISVEMRNINPPEIASIGDLDLFQKICTVIEAPQNSAPVFSNIPQADNIYESYITSNYLDRWKGLVTSLHFASCEVLAGP